ncbi:MAG: hypothetical protein NVSMB13_20210 [Mycobacteriales bacterium]
MTRRNSSATLGVALAVLAAVVGGVVVGVALAPHRETPRGRSGSTTAAQSAGPSAKPDPGRQLNVLATTSVDPTGGSGLQLGSDGRWSTQHYSSAAYGGLKPGVGLLLDVGSPQRVTRAGLSIDSPGIGLQLFGVDQPVTSPSGAPDAELPSASGDAVLTTGGAVSAHRYWLLWIPRLVEDGSGFHASVAKPTLLG